MLQEAGHEADVVAGERSQYDVVSDGEVLFSKQGEGRFPENEEILELVTPRPGATPG